jgi:predicted membrane protein
MRNKLWPIFWGLFFIVLGVGYGGDALNLWNFTMFFRGWWTFFIIIPCLISLIQNGYSIGDFIGLVIGILLLLSGWNIINLRVIGKLIFPAILILIGISIMFKDVFIRKKKVNVNIKYQGDSRDQYAIFSGNKQKETGVFLGASINAIFGGFTLDLRDATIEEDIVIKATAIFGGVDIYVPPGVVVRTSSVPIFGGVSNKVSDPVEANAPVILVNSVCMFGGVEIK